MLKKLLILCTAIAFTVTTLIGMWVISCENFLNRTYITYDFKINKNETFNSTYNKLFQHLKTPYFFKYYLILVKKFDKKIKYGHYNFNNVKISDAITAISSGNTYKIKITFPEGFNMYDIAKLLAEKNITKYNLFISKCTDKTFIKKLTKMNIMNLEGFLYPETYFFDENSNPENIINKMYNTFVDNLPANFEEKAKSHNLTFYQAVILASIIQKETYKKDEMPIISSVFHNRLKRRMRLDSDPTIIYGIYENFDGNIRKRDLRNNNNIYNTYKINGLPPTPICNPDKYALEAAVNPAKTDYLYFVADKNGNHHFSTNYNNHRKLVNKYQK